MDTFGRTHTLSSEQTIATSKTHPGSAQAALCCELFSLFRVWSTPFVKGVIRFFHEKPLLPLFVAAFEHIVCTCLNQRCCCESYVYTLLAM